MASAINFLCFLMFFSSILFTPSCSNPIFLDLTPTPLPHSSHSRKEIIFEIAKSTLQRAYHIQNHNTKQYRTSSLKSPSPPPPPPFTPLFPRPGIYSVSLPLGTPQQNIPTIFDTGSSLVWVPCTSKYTCLNCTQTSISTFKPNKSSSKHSVKCYNPKCQWLDQPNMIASCPNCGIFCKSLPCEYLQSYGSGATKGTALFETLDLPRKQVKNFFIGCSSISQGMNEGILGFGRNPMSLPKQLKLTKFSHCLVSHNFDGTSKSSKLILGESNVSGVMYTPFAKNPSMIPFDQYYYVQLEKITVGGKTVNIPSRVLVPDSNGNGGSIIDSGSTFTALSPSIFDPFTIQFVANLKLDQRDRIGLARSNVGNLLCVKVSGVKFSFPVIGFHFKGGAKMDLPEANYLKLNDDYKCLPFVNVTFAVGLNGGGPAVILGNYQQQNFHIAYDLKNERLGLKRQIC